LSTNASRSSKAKPAQEALQRVEHRELLEALSRCTGDRLQGDVLLAAGLTAGSAACIALTASLIAISTERGSL
jgi:hypothetical protein